MEPDPRHVAYVQRWSWLGPELERIRDQEIRRANTIEAVQMFDSAFKAAMRDLPPRETSGLVEWGKLILKWRDRD
jgi:hypothetical protein